MGHLRAVAILAAVISIILIVASRTQQLSVTGVGAMIIGICALISVIPFPADTRAKRNRFTAACAIYTLGCSIFSVVAIASSPTLFSLLATVAPLMGLGLTVWAYKTRSRRRLTIYSNYHLN